MGEVTWRRQRTVRRDGDLRDVVAQAGELDRRACCREAPSSNGITGNYPVGDVITGGAAPAPDSTRHGDRARGLGSNGDLRGIVAERGDLGRRGTRIMARTA